MIVYKYGWNEDIIASIINARVPVVQWACINHDEAEVLSRFHCCQKNLPDQWTTPESQYHLWNKQNKQQLIVCDENIGEGTHIAIPNSGDHIGRDTLRCEYDAVLLKWHNQDIYIYISFTTQQRLVNSLKLTVEGLHFLQQKILSICFARLRGYFRYTQSDELDQITHALTHLAALDDKLNLYHQVIPNHG